MLVVFIYKAISLTLIDLVAIKFNKIIFRNLILLIITFLIQIIFKNMAVVV